MPITLDAVHNSLARHNPRRAEITGHLRGAAVALILAPGSNERLEILLIKRAERAEDPWSGQMAFPGGRRDPEDEDLMATAVRETAEETAVELSRHNLLGELDDLSPVSSHLPPIVVRPFVFALRATPRVQESDEVALYLWVPIDELGKLVEEEVAVRSGTLSVHGYRVGPHFVWGMTERILSPFLEFLRPG